MVRPCLRHQAASPDGSDCRPTSDWFVLSGLRGTDNATICANHETLRPKNFSTHLHCGEPGFSYVNEAYPGCRTMFITVGVEYESQFFCRSGVFGLLLPWACDAKLACSCYTARVETVDLKPSFKTTWKAARLCLIPVQAIYEPLHESGRADHWAHRTHASLVCRFASRGYGKKPIAQAVRFGCIPCFPSMPMATP